MINQQCNEAFAVLSTPLVADACVRLDLPLRVAPSGIRPLIPGRRVAGAVRPVRHYGSVDIFLEAYDAADPGDVLVIDNGGTLDEACIGDMTVLEAQAAGLAGIVVWGSHRDTADLIPLAFPVFTYGIWPVGPIRLTPRDSDALVSARVGLHIVSRDDFVFADDDGVLFVAADRVESVLSTARSIWETERHQADQVKAGRTLRTQFQFSDYLAKRAADPSYTFRQHLRALGKAIEE